MNFHKSRVIVFLGLVVAVGALVFLVATGFSVDFGSGGSADNVEPAPSDALLTDGGLLTSNRDRLAICFDAARGAMLDTTSTRKSLEEALRTATAHEYWSQAIKGPEPTVTEGCPQDPGVLAPDASPVRTASGLHWVTDDMFTDTPSAYRNFFYVISEDVFEAYFSDVVPFSIQEAIRLGHHQIVPVTYSVFVTPSQLEDEAYIQQLMLASIGLAHPATIVETMQ